MPQSAEMNVAQPANGAVGQDGILCGAEGGGVVAACCPGGGVSKKQPVSAIELFFRSFILSPQCSQPDKVPGVD